MVDKTLARFIKYMEVALVHRRIDYIKEISKIQEYEEELTDYKVSENSIDERNFIDLDILNEKEKELFNMLYKIEDLENKLIECKNKKIEEININEIW